MENITEKIRGGEVKELRKESTGKEKKSEEREDN